MSNQSASRRAFTIVELLVVVSILAVLIALLVPAVNKARSQAQIIRCSSNLRVIGSGFMMYTTDYVGFLPPVNSGGGYIASNQQNIATLKAYGMWNAIGPYVGQKEWGGIVGPVTSLPDPYHIKSDSYWGSLKKTFKNMIWCCPLLYEDVSASPWNRGYAESVYVQAPGGFGSTNTRAWAKARPRFAVRNPSVKIHVSESSDWHLGNLSSVGIPTSGTYTWEIYRHDGGCNILFLDGHVGFYKGKDIIHDITRVSSTTSIDNFNLN